MSEKFNYKGSISQQYSVKKWNDVLSCATAVQVSYSQAFDIPVSAYAFSNVDTFGAQVLCWHGPLASASIVAGIHAAADAALSADPVFGSAWQQISSQAEADATEISKAGWMSVNNRTLTPA